MMSKPVFKDLFKFEGRRNRQSFFLASLAIVMIPLIAVGLSISTGEIALETGEIVSEIFIPIAILPISIIISAQRCRDLGWTGWAALLELIPVIGFIFLFALFFIPGTDGENRYGPDPLK